MEIVACMATIPERQTSLYYTIQSILPQVDKLYIYFNGFSSLPSFIDNEKIVCRTNGDLGAAGKFYWIDKITDGYIFTIDDDIVYPENYTQYMVNTLQKYHNTVALGVHGSIFRKPFTRYLKRNKAYVFQREADTDKFVQLIGTGTLAFHRDTLDLNFDMFYPDIMCDLVFSIEAFKQKIPLITPKRGNSWLKQQKTRGKSYYDKMLRNDGGRTQMARKHNWGFRGYSNMIKQWAIEHYDSLDNTTNIKDVDIDFLEAVINGRTPKSWK